MTKIITVAMIILSMSTIGCSSCDKKDVSAQARACMSSPECMMKANMMASQYGGKIPYSVLQNPNPSILTGNNGGAPAVLPYKTAAKQDASDKAIKQQSLKVQDEINKFADNPDSSYYDPVQSVIPRSSDSDRGLPTQNDQVGLQRSIADDSDGEGVR